MPTYTLTLKPTTSNNETATWSSSSGTFNSNGWQNGDILIVTCSFDLSKSTNSADYVGLCVGACPANSSEDITALENITIATIEGQLLNLDSPTIIKDSTNPPATAIFYNATCSTKTYTLNSGSKLKNYIYQWTMTYNYSNTIATGTNVEIVFDFGDPRCGKAGTPVKSN